MQVSVALKAGNNILLLAKVCLLWKNVNCENLQPFRTCLKEALIYQKPLLQKSLSHSKEQKQPPSQTKNHKKKETSASVQWRKKIVPKNRSQATWCLPVNLQRQVFPLLSMPPLLEVFCYLLPLLSLLKVPTLIPYAVFFLLTLNRISCVHIFR